ncbi:MAG: anthranilate synthase component I family protein [Planctomycetota bacterium]
MHPAAPDNTPTAHAIRCWPAGTPLAATASPSGNAVIAAPAHTARLLLTKRGPAWDASPCPSIPAGPTADPIADLGVISTAPAPAGWLGWLAYELGERTEPACLRASPDPIDDRATPLAVVCRLDNAHTRDDAGLWSVIGSPPPIGAPSAAQAELELENPDPQFYCAAVRRAIELINAGDIFQANLAHRLTGHLRGSSRALAADWLDTAAPRYGAVFDLLDGGPSVISASPELFLSLGTDGRITTRPMKGTRPDRPGALDDLRSSPKDAAELAMIVDLMRNDLGRVARFGSVRVDSAREIERHGGADPLLQGVATITARLAAGRTLADLLRASFPAGSVTGAPKVRAMQIIRELEPVRRGPYCGSVIRIESSGLVTMSVSIRTACITGEVFDFHAGAGIVADSDPDEEWTETLAKAQQVTSLAGRLAGSPA